MPCNDQHSENDDNSTVGRSRFCAADVAVGQKDDTIIRAF